MLKKIFSLNKKMIVTFGFIVFLLLCTGVKAHAQLPYVKILGGSYDEVVHQDYDHERFRVHYLISKQAWERLGVEIVSSSGGVNSFSGFITYAKLQNWAPVILMTKEDYVQTRSYWGVERSDEANSEALANIDYEIEQLLDYGDVMGLLMEECADIKSKFDYDYDEAIAQMFKSIKGKIYRIGNVLRIDLSPGERVEYIFKKEPICDKEFDEDWKRIFASEYT